MGHEPSDIPMMDGWGTKGHNTTNIIIINYIEKQKLISSLISYCLLLREKRSHGLAFRMGTARDGSRKKQTQKIEFDELKQKEKQS